MLEGLQLSTCWLQAPQLPLGGGWRWVHGGRRVSTAALSPGQKSSHPSWAATASLYSLPAHSALVGHPDPIVRGRSVFKELEVCMRTAVGQEHDFLAEPPNGVPGTP